MSMAPTLIRQARTRAHLSRGALAARAGVATSTVSRIEEEAMEPTLAMLDRLLTAAGMRLELSTAPLEEAPALSDLRDAERRTPFGESADWTRLRAFIDWVEQHPHRTGEAISQRPVPSSSALLDALLASIAEKLADDHGLRRPAWTRRVPALEREWAPPGTPAMAERARRTTPSTLRARNIALSQSDLWRARA